MRRLGLRWSVALAVWLSFVAAMATGGLLADQAARAGVVAANQASREQLGAVEMNLLFNRQLAPRQVATVLGNWGNADVFVRRRGSWVSVSGSRMDWPHPCLPSPSEATQAPQESGRPFDGECGQWHAVGFWANTRVHGPVAVVALTPRDNFSAADALRRQMAWMGCVGGLLAAAGAWWVSGALTAPLRRAGSFALRFAAGERDVRLPVQGRDDVAVMSREFNTMAEQVTRSMAAQQRFISDTAHELRTPAAALLASADALDNPRTRDRAVAVVAPQLRRLSSLTTDLLALSRFDADAELLDLQRVDLTALARRVVADAGCSDQVAVAGAPVEVDCDPVRVRSIIDNLLSNALRHGRAPVAIVVDHTAISAVLRLSDAGPGVPEPVRPTIFDRFVRGDTARQGEGTGLGLAIAREHALLHGGGLTLDPDGRTFRLELPLNPPAEPGSQPVRSAAAEHTASSWAKAVFLVGTAAAGHAVWALTRPYRGDPQFLDRLHTRWAAGTWLFGGWALPVYLGAVAGTLFLWLVLQRLLRRAGRTVRLGAGLLLVAGSVVIPSPADARILPVLAGALALLLVSERPADRC